MDEADGAMRSGLAAAGIPEVDGADEATRADDTRGIAYLPLERLSPPLFRLLKLREVLRFRPCINTVCRMLDPGKAGVSVQWVFHPPYRLLQADAAQALWCRCEKSTLLEPPPMKSFPMFIRTTGRRVIIAGGGETAAQKARLILKTDARFVILAHELEPELQAIVCEGRAAWHAGQITAALCVDAAVAFVGTGCPGIDASLHALARAARCPVNVVDQPDLCEITTPAIVDRDPIVIAIGSEGTAPILTRDIKTKPESLLPRNIGGLAALAV